MPGSVLSTLHVLSHLIFTTNEVGPVTVSTLHSTHEARRGRINCPKSQSWWGFKPKQSGFESVPLTTVFSWWWWCVKISPFKQPFKVIPRTHFTKVRGAFHFSGQDPLACPHQFSWHPGGTHCPRAVHCWGRMLIYENQDHLPKSPWIHWTRSANGC